MSAPPTDVVDPLARLAARAPSTGLDPDALWSRGRRRQRGRVLVALAAAVVVAVGGAAAGPDLLAQAQEVQVAGTADPWVLPDLVREPGGWEGAFPAAPGRLSAVGFGQRSGLWSTRGAWWGVSAATGESRFLELPGAADAVDAPVLSADGWRLAYWVTGDVPGEPLSMGAPTDDDVDPVVGVAVLDLRTGDRRAWTLDTEHGLATGGLAWTGEVLWWSAGTLSRSGESGLLGSDIVARKWDVAADRRVEPSGPESRVWPDNARSAPGGFVEYPRRHRLVVVTDAGRRVLRAVLPDGSPRSAGLLSATLAPDGSRVVALLRPDANVATSQPQQLVVGRVDGATVRLEPVPGATAGDVLGWRSPTEVVVASLAEVEEGRPSEALEASTVDLVTGERSRVLTFSGTTPQVAADAWSAAVVPAPGAPLAPDPRWIGVGVLLAALTGWRLLVWRRRRERA